MVVRASLRRHLPQRLIARVDRSAGEIVVVRLRVGLIGARVRWCHRPREVAAADVLRVASIREIETGFLTT